MRSLSPIVHSRAGRIARVALVTVLALALVAGPVMAKPYSGLKITLDAPDSACPGETIVFRMRLINVGEACDVDVRLDVHGRDVSGKGTLIERTVSMPEHGLAFVYAGYTVPLPAAQQAIWPWDLQVTARYKADKGGWSKAEETVRVLALTDMACEGGPTPVPDY